jgi:hypothetical protein
MYFAESDLGNSHFNFSSKNKSSKVYTCFATVVVLVTQRTTKLGLRYSDFSTNWYWIYKYLLKHLRSEETSCTQTPARFKDSLMCPRPPPTVPRRRWRARWRWGEPHDANKQVGRSIGLTRGRLASETWPGNSPVMADGEATAARPLRLGLRRNAGEARPSRARGSSSGC